MSLPDFKLEWWVGDGCELAGAHNHRVDTTKNPSGWASVPIVVNDNGKNILTRMVAGSVTTEARSSLADHGGEEADQPQQDLRLESIRPIAGWWICGVNESKEPEGQAG